MQVAEGERSTWWGLLLFPWFTSMPQCEQYHPDYCIPACTILSHFSIGPWQHSGEESRGRHVGRQITVPEADTAAHARVEEYNAERRGGGH